MHYFNCNLINKVISVGEKRGNKKFRYKLEIHLSANTSSKTAVVILKNPSKACENNLCISRKPNGKVASDKTINRVVYILSSNYNRIIVLNLFPIMETNPSEIFNFYSSSPDFFDHSLAKNRNTIIDVLKTENEADVICAWGGYSGKNKEDYDKTVFDYLKIIVKYNHKPFEYCPNLGLQKLTKFYPIHGCKW
ncbi:MAG: DUF1643 domain-containing protein [Bacilli bacterium]|nr:DUF1643 domain-containing protein [Bacilli bacterium]